MPRREDAPEDEEEKEDRSYTARIEQYKKRISDLLETDPGTATKERFRLNVGEEDFTPELTINGTLDNNDSNEKRAALFETVGIQDDSHKVAFAFKLRIREGVSDAVVERFA